jgi:8-oxo-dGTP pyrophosphatase MutT (NUDIX family)
MVGGKVGLGEHIRDAAIREVLEETGAPSLDDYSYRGFVSERLVQPNGELSSHFLIFVNFGRISNFKEGHREGDLALFTSDEIETRKVEFLPSDWFMFKAFQQPVGSSQLYEAELVQEGSKYTLNYYRKVDD